MYLRKSKTLPDAWWGRYVETVETESGTVRIQRNVRLGDARQYTKPLAKEGTAGVCGQGKQLPTPGREITDDGKRCDPVFCVRGPLAGRGP